MNIAQIKTALSILALIITISGTVLASAAIDHQELDRLEQVEMEQALTDEEAVQAEAEENFTDMDCQMLLENKGELCGDTKTTIPNPFTTQEATKP